MGYLVRTLFWYIYNVLLLFLVDQTLLMKNQPGARLAPLGKNFYSDNSKWPPPVTGKRKLLKKTILLQKRAIRTINKAAYNSHTEPLHKRTSILKINDQYDYEVAMFMRDYMRNKLPVSFQNTYQHNYEIQESHQTRSSNQLNIKRCDSKFAKSLPLYSFPEAWNSWEKRVPSISVGSRGPIQEAYS